MLNVSIDDTPRRIAASLTPFADESLPGFICRLADWNMIGAPYQLYSKIGTWPSAALSELDLARLAKRTGTGHAELTATYERSFLPSFSSRIRSWKRRRLSPESLRRSPHHRSVWQISHLPYCPVSWTALIDTCPACEALLKWDALTRCRRCDYDLREASTAEAPHHERAGLAKIAGLLTDQSTAPVDVELPVALTASQYAELIIATGRAFVAAPESSTLKLQSDRLLEGLRIVEGLPSTVVELSELDANKVQHPFFARLAASKRSGPVGAAVSAMLEMRPMAGLRRLREARKQNDAMTATELAASLGVGRSSLRRIIDYGVLGPRKTRGRKRVYDWFSESDRDVLEGVIDGRMSASTWAASVGLRLSDVRQLLALGLLREPSEKAACKAFPGLQLEVQVARELRERLIDVAPVDGSLGVPVARLFQLVGGGYKPWGRLIEQALKDPKAGGLFHVRGDNGCRIGDVWIVREQARLWITRGGAMSTVEPVEPEALAPFRPKTLTWTEVEELLNCNPADVSRLAKLKLIHGASAGRRPAFDAREVEALSGEFISGRELCARTSRAASALSVTLKKSGWPRNEAGLWARRGIETVLPPLQLKDTEDSRTLRWPQWYPLHRI